MKNKLGTPNMTIKSIMADIAFGISLCASKNKPVSAVNPNVNNTNNKTLGARFAVSNSIPQIISYILGVSLICTSCCMNTLAIDIDKKYTTTELKKLISTLEVEHKIPKGLLAAIAKIESGNKAYALNMAGTSYIAKSIDEAASVVSEKVSSGYTNIDVGVMQLNYRWHGGEFDSIEEMLTPLKNITYAAKLLVSLKKQHGDWHKAVRYYHSATPEHHKKYSRKVVLCWLNS